MLLRSHVLLEFPTDMPWSAFAGCDVYNMKEATLCNTAGHQCVPTAVIICLQSNTASVMHLGLWSCCYLSKSPTHDLKRGVYTGLHLLKAMG